MKIKKLRQIIGLCAKLAKVPLKDLDLKLHETIRRGNGEPLAMMPIKSSAVREETLKIIKLVTSNIDKDNIKVDAQKANIQAGFPLFTVFEYEGNPDIKVLSCNTPVGSIMCGVYYNSEVEELPIKSVEIVDNTKLTDNCEIM